MPEFGFLRLHQVLAMIPVGKSTWWEWVKAGKAPAGIKLGANIRAWRVEEIRALIEKLTIEGGVQDAR
jgi:prophage regulatory protein